jgi:hypothetical protein
MVSPARLAVWRPMSYSSYLLAFAVDLAYGEGRAYELYDQRRWNVPMDSRRCQGFFCAQMACSYAELSLGNLIQCLKPLVLQRSSSRTVFRGVCQLRTTAHPSITPKPPTLAGPCARTSRDSDNSCSQEIFGHPILFVELRYAAISLEAYCLIRQVRHEPLFVFGGDTKPGVKLKRARSQRPAQGQRLRSMLEKNSTAIHRQPEMLF